jgi:hypothetical protein
MSEEDFAHREWVFIRNNTGLSWSDLLKKRVVVILGEMGIGKTFEFQHQAIRLQQEDKAAFFLPLNQITSQGSAQAVLDDQAPQFEKWCRSGERGYFFLDAVDEARLNGPPALQTALRAIRNVLQAYLQRSSFFVSSRITDWSVPGVQQTVEDLLLKPLCDAEPSRDAAKSANTDTLEVNGNKNVSSIPLEVYCLDPLSEADAKRYAEAHGAKPVEAFWQAVEEGGYEFMASRPLDLEWMAKQWVASKKLGTYAELVETAVTHRLRETNQSYIDSGAVLSPAQLREGAEQIAAACTFSGRPYVSVAEDEPMDSAVSPATVLPHWTPLEHRRLLGTAIFDEGTYGRVKFHHRAVREYLAAYWVERRLKDGLPLAHALGLFIQAPYGVEVLVNNRWSVLCWLASLNARVCERVIRQFPEMLMFEGDPQCWSTEDIVEAFKGYIQRLEAGYRQDWWNSESELRRVARVLPPDLLAESLGPYSKSQEVLYRLLRLIDYGKVTPCADAVFALYRAPETSEENRQYALSTLASVAKSEQREAIAEDLISGKLQSNALIAAALRAVGLQTLTVEDLTAILRRTPPESDVGGGLVARAIKSDLLPAADFQALQKLLTAILCVLPGERIKERRFQSATGRLREFWMLSVLPDCFRRGIDLMVGDGTEAPQALVDAALWMENLQHSVYVSNEDYQSLRAEIGKHLGFRRRIARAIALSDDAGFAVYRLTWRSLVGCTREDLDWLLREAMREGIDPAERQVWYRVARNIAFSLRGKPRQQALATLTAGVDGLARVDDIKTVRARRIEDIQTKRDWKREERTRKAEQRRQLEESKIQLLQEIGVIRDGSGIPAMQRLIIHAAEWSSLSRYTKISLEPIVRAFGHELTEVFSEGLRKVWRQIRVPSPADYPDNHVPWDGLIGLAGVKHAFAMGLDVQSLSAEDITRAVQLCIWEIERLEPWLDELAELRADTVAAALMPWFEYELGLPADNSRYLRTVDLVLRAPHALQRPFLGQAVELMRDGKVCDERLQMRLFRACTEAHVPAKELVAEFACRYLMSSANAEKPAFASEWVAAWAAVDFVACWSWLETNASVIAKDAAALVGLVAEGLKSAAWAKELSGTEAEVTALVSLFRFLSIHAEASQPEPDADKGVSLAYLVRGVRDSIPRILAALPGKAAHAALQGLAVENAGTAQRDWLQRLLLEHASAEAERRSVVSADELPGFGEVYCREPRTAEELYAQVVARLQEIREGIEGGPFSDRVLFEPGMNEKKLQLWLAARLSDTPLRRFIPRFRVHREPQVDDDNRTDIEVSSAAGKVCIEIKPVDSCRPYTANSLTKTLRDQLVRRYLRGQNSKHGVLVVFRLEDRKWKIPGGSARGDFNELVEYLEAQAAKIRVDSADVEDLRVIGIDCVSTKPPIL